jgi:hypothetical protein
MVFMAKDIKYLDIARKHRRKGISFFNTCFISSKNTNTGLTKQIGVETDNL